MILNVFAKRVSLSVIQLVIGNLLIQVSKGLMLMSYTLAEDDQL